MIPEPIQDDILSAERARAAGRRVMEQFDKLIHERDAARAEVGRLAGELVREMAQLEATLAEWEILILMVPEGAEGPTDVGLYLQRLQAVAEAAKALAAIEQWKLI